jgi:hypothetical protein
VPAAIIVEVFVAGHFVGNITRASAPIFAVVAGARPLIESIALTDCAHIVAKLLDASKNSLLPFLKTIRAASARDLSVAVPHHCSGLVATLIYVQPIFARLINGQCQVRRVNLESLTVTEMTHTEIKRAR